MIYYSFGGAVNDIPTHDKPYRSGYTVRWKDTIRHNKTLAEILEWILEDRGVDPRTASVLEVWAHRGGWSETRTQFKPVSRTMVECTLARMYGRDWKAAIAFNVLKGAQK